MTKKILISSISIITGLFLVFAVIMAIVLANGKMALGIDNSVANFFYSTRGEKGDFGYWFFRIITELGHYYFVIAIILIIAIVWKFRGKTWFLAIPVAASWGLHEIIKLFIKRPRPDALMQWMTESSSSFPSGHSSTATCLFVLLIFFVVISPHLKQWLKILFSSLCTIAIVLVPISRLFLGMHYFSDVLAGMCWGGAFAVLGILLYRLFVDKKLKQEKTTQEKQKQKKNEK